MPPRIEKERREKRKKVREREEEEAPKIAAQAKAESFAREQERRKAEVEADKRSLEARGLMKSPEEKRGEKFLEEKGFFEEKIPEPVELEEERTGIEKVPIIGPGFKGAGQAIVSYILDKAKSKEGLKAISKEQIPLIQDPETAKEIALREIQIKEVLKGTSASEKFGAVIESIPIIGPLAGKYAGGMLETPSANVDTVIKNIKESRGRVLKKYEATRANLIDPYIAYQSILDEEENIFMLEQRIKNLSIESAELIADADKLNVIEGKILRAKEVIFFAKQASATALRGEPTDASVEAWLISEMKALEEE